IRLAVLLIFTFTFFLTIVARSAEVQPTQPWPVPQGGGAGKCGYYVNSNGNRVPRPCGDWRSDPKPLPGATVRCRDGSWSWSQHPHAWGACSHHGGVESYR